MGLVLLCVIWVITGTMEALVGREVELILGSHSVIHNFFVPQMPFPQHAVPESAIQLERASTGEAGNPYSGGRA